MTTKQEQSGSIGSLTFPKRLYHGTKEDALPRILDAGLSPRSATSAEGNWEQYPSRPDMVYLTTAYAPYFAMMAEGEGNPVVLEIDTALLRQDLFFPDEDFVAQAIREKTGLPLSEIHGTVRESLDEYQEFAAASLAALGNAAYRGTIPPDAIVRVCVIAPDQQPASMMTACDPCISPLNYRFVGEKYRSLTAWLFGDRPDWDLGYGDNEQYFAFMDKANAGDSSVLRQAFHNRQGITVRHTRRQQ